MQTIAQGNLAPSQDIQAQEVKMNSTQERILNLLGSGYPPSVVSSAAGVSESYISQLMSLDWFANLVQEMKFLQLRKHTELDDQYDDLEEVLLRKLSKAATLLIKPMEITKVLQTVNAAKRRGAGNSEVSHLTQNIVNLSIPEALARKFISNTNNQIVEVQDGNGQSSSLVTTSSGSLERLSREARADRELENTIRGELSQDSTESQAISPQALEALANATALSRRLTESRKSSGSIKAEDL